MAFEEIEVKFHVAEPADVRSRLAAAGAENLGASPEHNTRWDDAAASLRQGGCLLRLRRDAKSLVTFKAPPAEADPEFKVHREWEVEVSDLGAMADILRGLGFAPVQVYEKVRETHVLGETKILLDTLPYGVFLEFEGRREHIRRLAADLGFAWEDRITANYLAIHEALRRTLGLAFTDVTFENYRGRENAAGAVLADLVAGS